jgi:hypothetical protein
MYGAQGDGCDLYLTSIEGWEGEDLPLAVEFDDGLILSPLCPAQVIFFTPESQSLNVAEAVYGCLPNGEVIVVLINDLVPDEAIDTDNTVGARVILDPFTDEDDHVVEDVVFNLLEDE